MRGIEKRLCALETGQAENDPAIIAAIVQNVVDGISDARTRRLKIEHLDAILADEAAHD